MKSEIINKVSGKMARVGFQLKKHSPEILIVFGLAGTVASAVMACVATTKINDILDEAKTDIDEIHDVMADEGAVEESGLTKKDANKALAHVYAKTGVELAKLYGPAVILGTLSMGCVLASNDILRKRNVALAAAYASVDKGFKEYRNRVIDRFGKEVDQELKYDIKSQKVETVEVDENGKEKKVKKTVEVANPNAYSPYAKFFDSSCLGYSDNAEYNLCFLKAQQASANELLKNRKFLFLNDVYDMLGIERTKAGQVVGWVYDEEHPVGDNFIDFGIYDTNIEANRRFVNGLEKVILLDFNVDGNVWDLM